METHQCGEQKNRHGQLSRRTNFKREVKQTKTRNVKKPGINTVPLKKKTRRKKKRKETIQEHRLDVIHNITRKKNENT